MHRKRLDRSAAGKRAMTGHRVPGRLSVSLAVAIALGLSARLAAGGPNRNGAIIVHTNDAYTYAGGTVCSTPLGDPGTCAAAITRSDKSSGTVVWLLASFLPTASPSVTAVYFGINYAGAGLDPGDAFKPCGPAGTQQLPDADWPYTGRGNTVAFPTPVTGDILFPFYAFNIEGGAAGSWFGTAVNPIGGYAAFVDASNPPQTDRCVNFGSVRWYEAGSNSCPVASNCQITVASPAGGESWQQGSLHNIRWNSSQCGGSVMIEILLNGSVCGTIAPETPNDGSYGWIARQCFGNPSGYKIRITDLDAGNSGVSGSSFSIPTGVCQVDVSYPDGGETIDAGTDVQILWGSTGCGSQVRIDLIADGTPCTVITPSAPNNGAYPWNAEVCGAVDCVYRIRVTDTSTGSGGESETPFCIRSCTPVVVFPNGGETLTLGTSRTISWSSTNCDERIRIDLLRNGSACATIAADTENDGDFPWIVGGCAGETEGYKIRITDLASGRYDESNADFCIGCGDIIRVQEGVQLTVGQDAAEIPLLGVNAEAIRGFSIHLNFDSAVFECLGFSTAGTRSQGEVALQQACGNGEAAATVTYATSCPPQIAAGDGPLIKLLVRVKSSAPLGPSNVDLADSPAGLNRMTPCSSPSFAPVLQDGSVEILPERFQRGDDDANGTIDIADPIFCLSFQYGGGAAPPCKDAGDFDDSGRYDITDCIANLCRQFGSCPAPPPPAAECGPDPTSDLLDCASFPPCQPGKMPAALHAPTIPAVEGTIVVSCAPRVDGDSTMVEIAVWSDEPVVGFQLDASYDPSLLRFVRIVPPLNAPDYLSARREGGRSLHMGCIFDIEMTSPLPAGSHQLGSLVFAMEKPLPEDGTALLLSGMRFVKADLGVIDADRIEFVLTPAHVGGVVPPLAFPNPFRPKQEIRLNLTRSVRVRLDVYNVQGQRVRVLHDGPMGLGSHLLRWDGRTDDNGEAGSGIYYLRAIVGGRTIRRSITLLR